MEGATAADRDREQRNSALLPPLQALEHLLMQQDARIRATTRPLSKTVEADQGVGGHLYRSLLRATGTGLRADIWTPNIATRRLPKLDLPVLLLQALSRSIEAGHVSAKANEALAVFDRVFQSLLLVRLQRRSLDCMRSTRRRRRRRRYPGQGQGQGQEVQDLGRYPQAPGGVAQQVTVPL